MNILIVPNAFKSSLSALEAGNEIALGFSESNLDCTTCVLPIADGGDGSLPILAHYLEAEILYTKVADPIGREIEAGFAINRKKRIGIIELAEASGIKLLQPEELNPWITNTRGTGQLILAALEHGCDTIYLTVGGSATVDVGIGILRTLGVKFFAGNEQFLPTGPCDFHKIDRIDASEAKAKYQKINFIILADVDNPLIGKRGAVQVYGPQKGVAQDEMELFENSIVYWSDLLEKTFGKNIKHFSGGGASGGVAAGLVPIFNVDIQSGSAEILKLAGFENAAKVADLIITTEGKIDAQTGFGKGPGWVARLANERNIPVIALCGQIDDDYNPKTSLFDAAFPINSMLYNLKTAISRTRPNLRFTAMQVANLLSGMQRRK